MARHWKSGLIGGVLSLAAYWIVIWAMTVAPIALVAALRETSVLFAAAIAVVFLKEPLQRDANCRGGADRDGLGVDPAAVTHHGEVPYRRPRGHDCVPNVVPSDLPKRPRDG